MKIFNEDLEKDLLFDELSLMLHNCLCTIFCSMSCVIISLTFGLVMQEIINHYPSNKIFLSLIMFLLNILLSVLSVKKIHTFFYKKSECHNTSSNPTLAKLKNAAKQQDCINLVKLWEHFNPDHPSNSIALGQNQKDIELLQKLDDDLVRFIENADDVTMKLFNLDDFESYKQLYMKYIAPTQKEEVLNKIQTLIENHGSNQESYLVQQLLSIKNEIEKYNTDTTDYFEFKKWHQDTLDMLKLDKDNDMVKNNYQNIIQEINNNQED